MAQLVKSLSAVRETWVGSLDWEDPLEKEMATHSSILVWRIPWREEPGGLQSMRSQRAGHDSMTFTFQSYVIALETTHCCLGTKSCPTLWDPMNCSTPGSLVLHTISWTLRKLMFIESVMSSNHLILCSPLLLLPLVSPSIRVFSNGSVLHIRWPKSWSFSFSINPSKAYSGLIFFGTDWFDFLVLQGTLRSLLQNHSSKASILWCSTLLMVPTLSSIHDYWKNHSFNYMDLCQESDVSAF